MDFSKKIIELRKAIRQFISVYQSPQDTSKFDTFVDQLNDLDAKLKEGMYHTANKASGSQSTIEEWDGKLEPKEDDKIVLKEFKKFLAYLKKEETAISKRLEQAQNEIATASTILIEEGENLLNKVFN